AEQLLAHRTREPRLPEVAVVAVTLEGDPLAGAEGFDELVDWASARHCELGERRSETQARFVDEHLVVTGREDESTILRPIFCVLDAKNPACRLLLEPLARVPRVDSGGLRQLAGRGGMLLGKSTVETEPVTEINAVEVKGGDRGLKEALGERVTRGGHGDGRHGRGRVYGGPRA